MFKNYTRKQWGVEPEALGPEVMDRIPVRENFDDRYFDDPYQAVPVVGYTATVRKMLANPRITVKTGVDYFNLRDQMPKPRMVFYTGRLDRLVGREGNLHYRSLLFDQHTFNLASMLPAATVNYPNDYQFTRKSEPKKATGQWSLRTTVVTEYPVSDGEPYYPIPAKEYEDSAVRMRECARQIEGTRCLGRLATYRYINMDRAVREALDLFDEVKGEFR